MPQCVHPNHSWLLCRLKSPLTPKAFVDKFEKISFLTPLISVKSGPYRKLQNDHTTTKNEDGDIHSDLITFPVGDLASSTKHHLREQNEILQTRLREAETKIQNLERQIEIERNAFQHTLNNLLPQNKKKVADIARPAEHFRHNWNRQFGDEF